MTAEGQDASAEKTATTGRGQGVSGEKVAPTAQTRADGSAGRFADLGKRLISALILAGIALYAVFEGGFPLLLFLALFAGAMLWELARMLMPMPPWLRLAVGGAGMLGVIGAALSPSGAGLLLLLLPLLFGTLAGLHRRPWCWFGYGGAILAATLVFLRLRVAAGLPEVLWIIAVVIATDVGGYLFGRLIGGAKLMPAVSPGKTWSGTIGGWLVAALAGLGFALALAPERVVWLMAASLVLSVAAQAGDLVESAIKRRAGIKDSSRLIPGHGGALDRFDGMIGALIVAGGLEAAGLLPHF